ncbi:hypothetical protein [Pseudonocardia sp. McavD-2-B]|uniref:hypothetical protein n=1 Tax=Pseudonocardia sp. McavD-2-B TaxID=2954499 RepID=UPI0020971321|nr:hypothetical protein [Pseudonocardia sp. McavD-2-B]MCO7193321.1 hypothetical protein [Pseudonocardia sp. McavD-2-B]
MQHAGQIPGPDTGAPSRRCATGVGRYVLAATVAAVFTVGVYTAAPGVNRFAAASQPEFPAAVAATAASRPFRVDAGAATLGRAVDDAITATRTERDRAAAARRSVAVPVPAGDCAQRAMAAGRFDPSCPAYQGYLDPGSSAGRAPTSGETQLQFLCQKGLVPRSEC